jgi:hypothetical protein
LTPKVETFTLNKQVDSDQEREAAEFQAGLEKKLISQATKRSMKHNARLPRTAGLRTLSELSVSLKKAGLDPSKIEQRAALIAKARGLESKRKRGEQMDVDEEGEREVEEEEGGDWMDVDEEDDGGSPRKRRKSNTGTVVTSTGKHAPRTNRQTAGLRDQTQVSKAVKLRNLGQRERNMHARAGESDRAIKVKMVSFVISRSEREGTSKCGLLIIVICSRSTCFLANERRERPKDDEGVCTYSLSLFHRRLHLQIFPPSFVAMKCFLPFLHLVVHTCSRGHAFSPVCHTSR